jgi:predicted transcriptional regulator
MTDKEGALEHKARKAVYDYIMAHPGVPFGTIQKVFNMNASTLKYHLNYLEKNHQVISKREGRHRLYFCIHSSASRLKPSPASKIETLTDVQRYLLNVIRNDPGIKASKLASVTNMNQKNLSYNIQRLIDQQLIWRVQNGGEIAYEYITAEKLRYEMYNKLLMKLLANEIDEATFLRIKRKLDEIDIDDIDDIEI